MSVATLMNYYDNLNDNDRLTINKLRKLILKEVPKAKEVYKWGMPVFELNGKYIIGINATKNHIAIYPGAEPIEILKSKLSGYSTSKGTIRFIKENEIDTKLIKEVLDVCFKRAVTKN